jgi:hypothetical protein
MTKPNRNRRFVVMIVVMIIVGSAALSLAVWFTLDGSTDGIKSAAHDGTEMTLEGGSATTGASPARIVDHGRLTLNEDALPDQGPLALVLDLPDDARGTGAHGIRIVSLDGRRLETTATPLPGSGTGVQLEIDTAFLSRGRYMIEIDTVEKHPLQLRRYVLELK